MKIIKNLVFQQLQRRFMVKPTIPIDWKQLQFATKVPQSVVRSKFDKKTERIKITEAEMNLLERLSLVDLDRTEAVNILEDSIEFASLVQNIDTTNVQPLYTILEKCSLQLRNDKVADGNIKEDVMRNAKKAEDDTYFIAPSGNVPLK